MTAPTLRPYQAELVERIESTIAAGSRRPLIVAATGSGKTVVFAELIRRRVALGQRVLVLAHLEEIVSQTSAKLHAVEVDSGIIKAGWPPRPHVAVQVASVATLHARAVRASRMEMPPADLIVVDECHHAAAKTWRRLLDAYPDADICGFSATPVRGDGRGLGAIFDSLIEAPDVRELTELGYLVPARCFAPSAPDLEGLRVRGGDYAEDELAERVDRAELVGDVVQHWHRLAEGRRTLVFAVGVRHSIHLRDRFRESGVMAEHLDGTTPKDERARVQRELESGAVQVLCNAQVLTEGADLPAIGCIVLARPTKSLGLYRQMVGRGLRTADGKADCVVLDHSGVILRLGLPDDRIAWTLDPDDRPMNATAATRERRATSRLTTCPECGAVRTAGEGCRFCGWTPERRPLPVAVHDGDLVPVGAGPRVIDQAERDRWLAELTAIAEQRGYQPGWTAHKFRERFGAWPPRIPIRPREPSREVRAWVRARAVEFSRAKRAAGE